MPYTPLKIHSQPAAEEPAFFADLVFSSPQNLLKEAGDVALVNENARSLRVQIGLGEIEKVTPESLRRSGGALGRFLRKHDVRQAGLDLLALHTLTLDAAQAEQAFLEGVLLGAYRFEARKSKPKHYHGSLYLSGLRAPEALQRAAILAEAVNLAREWGHEPPNLLTPATLAQRCQTLADEIGLECTIFDEADLEEMGAGGLVNVGKGSQNPPRLIVLEYAGDDPQAAPVALVGKAITFDTGGYSLKDKTGILGMKYDKCGAMAVIGALYAAAKLQLPVRIVALIAAAENMVSDNAYRPDDIITMLSGKTVEIVSADAEGRLVMADAMTYAQRHWQPQALIDVATLTGGVLVALGRVRAGLMSNHPGLSQALRAAGEVTFERLWELPLDEEFSESLKSEDADLKNSGGRDGHASIAGWFLQNFVENNTPWAHLDIAGMGDTPKTLPYCEKGATGFGVRLLTEYLEKLT
ncbi:MAG: leucyl aminopeptidase [Anaerolineales bacterium]